MAAKETCEEFEREGVEVVFVQTPKGFQGVGQWYEDFTQTTDEEVRECWKRIEIPAGETGTNTVAGGFMKELNDVGTQVTVPAGKVSLEGELAVPKGAEGVVLFAHGSGSSRHSPRNRFVAAALRRAIWGRCCSTC